jgi:hypothetical protein
MTKWDATLTDWCIVFSPEIFNNIANPKFVFAELTCGRPIALFGKAKDDPRFNARTGEFTNGHRLITTPIIMVNEGKYYTLNTIYKLYAEEKNENYRKWCEEKKYLQ